MYSQSRYYNNSPTPHHNPRNQQDFYSDTGSEIYIDQTYPHNNPPPPPPPRVQRALHNAPMSVSTTPRAITPIGRPHTTTPSEYSSVSKTKKKNKGGVVIETMSAPNPCCPDSKGVCCILLLVNLGLLLVTLGFSVVLQLFDPPFVWYCGILFIIVGFIALIVSLLFCMRICRWSRWSTNSSDHDPNELYWTTHWQKRINLPGTTSRTSNVIHDDVVYHSNLHGSRGVTPTS